MPRKQPASTVQAYNHDTQRLASATLSGGDASTRERERAYQMRMRDVYRKRGHFRVTVTCIEWIVIVRHTVCTEHCIMQVPLLGADGQPLTSGYANGQHANGSQTVPPHGAFVGHVGAQWGARYGACLLYTSPSPRD